MLEMFFDNAVVQIDLTEFLFLRGIKNCASSQVEAELKITFKRLNKSTKTGWSGNTDYTVHAVNCLYRRSGCSKKILKRLGLSDVSG